MYDKKTVEMSDMIVTALSIPPNFLRPPPVMKSHNFLNSLLHWSVTYFMDGL